MIHEICPESINSVGTSDAQELMQNRINSVHNFLVSA